MSEDLLTQHFVDVTMELYEDMQNECQLVNKTIEDLHDDIRLMYIALGGLAAGLLIAFSFFMVATRRLHRTVARERESYHDLFATIKAKTESSLFLRCFTLQY